MKYYCDKDRHLICIPYSVNNLHDMAVDLKIKYCWYHKAKFPHYDIPKKRFKEISEKCIMITNKELLRLIKNEMQNNK